MVEREVGLHRFLNQNSKRVTFLYGVHLDGNDAVFTAMERCGESLSQVRAHTHARISRLPLTSPYLPNSTLVLTTYTAHSVQWLSNAPDGRVANLPPRDRVDAAAAIVAAVADVHAVSFYFVWRMGN